MRRRGRFLAVLLLPACNAPQQVHFRRPRGASVEVREGYGGGRMPVSCTTPDRTPVPIELYFPLDSLLDAGLEREEAEALSRAGRNVLRGFLVTKADLCRRLFPIPDVRFGARDLRRGLVEGKPVRVTRRDWKGRKIFLLKASLDGVPADDPELAAVSGTGLVTWVLDGANHVLDVAFAAVVYVPLVIHHLVTYPYGMPPEPVP